MFTGIVEAIGRITRLEAVGGRVDLEVGVPDAVAGGVAIGDSVALDGCCLTVTRNQGSLLSFQAVPETLRTTSLGQRQTGDVLNVERALAAGGRLDGHIVQGHVDGVGEIAAWEPDGDDVLVRVRCPEEIASLLVHKGSVALDGVSLTVIRPEAASFEVALIPHTLAQTTLGRRQVGDGVNLEADVLGKYVHAYLERAGLSLTAGGAG